MELTLPAHPTRLVLYVYSSAAAPSSSSSTRPKVFSTSLMSWLACLGRGLGLGLRLGLGLGLGGREAWREGERRDQRASEGSGVTREHTSS